jgi:hypothetical protein
VYEALSYDERREKREERREKRERSRRTGHAPVTKPQLALKV